MLPADAMTVCALMEAFHGGRLDERRRWEAIERCVGPDPSMEGWLLCEGPMPAGYAMLARVYDPALACDTAELVELWVDPAYRALRTGEHFLEALPGLCAGCGYVTVPASGMVPLLHRLGYGSEAPVMRAPCPPAPEPEPAPPEEEEPPAPAPEPPPAPPRKRRPKAAPPPEDDLLTRYLN